MIKFLSGGGGESMTVCKQTSPDLAYSNKIYMNPTDFEKFPEGFAMVAGSIFTIAKDAELSLGQVAFNGKQRSVIELKDPSFAIGQQCQVVTPNMSTVPHAKDIMFKLQLMSKRRATVEEDNLVTVVRMRYKNHVLHVGDQIPLSLAGFTFMLHVERIKINSDEHKSGSIKADQALFNPDAVISVSPRGEQSLLDWHKALGRNDPNQVLKEWDFEDLGIGGLSKEFNDIFRRAFTTRTFSAAEMEEMGVQHVKGMLLHGPPGTGKTLIARQIGKLLNGVEPLVVNGPEILNKFVGASEENIRKLFEPAEAEWEEKKDASQLHIIIFDEIDAICKQRGSVRSGTGVHDTVVNQLLSKIDGVNSPNNILIIGMTNRKDLIDTALLRPGRLEVHVEISLPDEKGREEIFKIHTRKLLESNHLGEDVDIEQLASLSRNFSGAEIQGVVKAATSYALYRNSDVTQTSSVNSSSAAGVKVTMENFLKALEVDVHAAFGVEDDLLDNCMRGGMISYGPRFERLLETGMSLVQQVRDSDNTHLLSMLCTGHVGSGKTALAAYLAKQSQFPFVRLISPENLIGYSESGKINKINKVFEDAYKSKRSLVIVDNIERLLDFVEIGNSVRFSNTVLQGLLVLLKKVPPTKGRHLMIIGTTNLPDTMRDLGVMDAFNVSVEVGRLSDASQMQSVFQHYLAENKNITIPADVIEQVCQGTPFPLGIQQALHLIEMTLQSQQGFSVSAWNKALENSGLIQ